MTTRQALAALLMGCTALVASTSASTKAEEVFRTHYLCVGQFDAVDVSALFFKGAPSEVVLLVGSEGASRLLQQPAASGARYASGDQEFWIKGDEASWTRGSGNGRSLRCKVGSSGVSSGSPAPTR